MWTLVATFILGWISCRFWYRKDIAFSHDVNEIATGEWGNGY